MSQHVYTVKKLQMLFAVVIAFFLTSAPAVFSQVTIIENNTERFSFEWNCSEIDTMSINDSAVSLKFHGSNTISEQSGGEIIPGYSFLAGVPSEGTISATFTPTSTRTVTLAHPLIRANRSDYGKDTAYRSVGNSWISAPDYTRLRSIRAARLVIWPVRYNSENQSVTIATSGVCTITFPKAPHSPARTILKNDYDKTVSRLLANYDIAQGWKTTQKFAKRKSAAYPLPYGKQCFYFKVGDGHSDFNETTISENGIMKISGSAIRSRFGNVNISKVKLFASVKGMLPDPLPADGSIPDGISESPILRIDKNSNGILDEEDYLLVYVSGASDWEYNRSYQANKFSLNVYDDYRTYWIAAGTDDGLTMSKVPAVSATPETTQTTFLNRVMYKQSRIRANGNNNNRDWLWKVLSKNQRQFVVTLDLPGIDKTLPGRLNLTGVSKNHASTAVSIGDITLDEDSDFDSPYDIDNWDNLVLRCTMSANTDTSQVEIDNFDVTYQRKLEIGDQPAALSILPDPGDTGRVIAYDMKVNTSQKIYILRVDQGDRDIALIDTIKMSGSGTYRWTDSSFAGRRYVVCNESALFGMPDINAPDAPLSGTNLVTDLRSESNHTDFLIITHPDFLPAADSLARHKKKIGFVNPVVVNIFDVYRYFSGGNKDAAAIRNFIGYVTRYWKKDIFPDYVLLSGTGHYDTKNYSSIATDFIPVYIDGDACYENYFTLVDTSAGSGTAQIALGRLPCQTIEHAWAMVKKIVATEDPQFADMGPWRNRMLFVADDDMQGMQKDPVIGSRAHHISSDNAAKTVDSAYPSIDIRKVYLYEYEWDQLRQKPGATIALINEINNGVGYINFFGHGADVTWTDEYILTADMVSRMNNHGKYPVISTFSCSVGRFDVPGIECLSGVLARSDDIGAVSVISSTREAYAYTNEELSIHFYKFLFDSLAGNSIGTSLIAAQILIDKEPNRTYCILGDPSIRAIRPSHRINLSIDNKDNAADTLKALQKITVSGTVQSLSGGVDKSFTGAGASVSIGLFNAPDTATRKDGGDDDVSYVLPGTALFLGKTNVTSGTFKQTVLIPQNLSFDKKGVRLVAYAWKDRTISCATGYKKSIIFHGSKPVDDVADKEGPLITVRPSYDNDYLSGGNASFSDHLTVQVPVTCEIELFDSSGIDAAGIGPDEGITLEIEGVVARQNVNSKFQFKEGDFRRGIVSVVYEEKTLKPGTYTMTVTGRDLIGNLAKSSFTLNVTKWNELDLDHVLNFPNPVRLGKETRFYCHTSYTQQQYWDTGIKLSIRIYTLSGKLLRVIKNARNGQIWDCRDQKGNLLSPDIYLYQITAEDTTQDKTKKSKIMKLVILPPR